MTASGIVSNSLIKNSSVVKPAVNINEAGIFDVENKHAGALLIIALTSGSQNLVFDESSLPIGSELTVVNASGSPVDLLWASGTSPSYQFYDSAGTGSGLSMPSGQPSKATITSLGNIGLYVTFS